jgi:hypothetical protein
VLYNLKEQSASREGKKIMNYLFNYHIDNEEKKNTTYKVFNGVLQLGSNNGNLQFETFEERARRIHKIDTFLEEIEKPEPIIDSDATVEEFVKQESDKSKELLQKAIKNHNTNNISLINTIEEVINGK